MGKILNLTTRKLLVLVLGLVTLAAAVTGGIALATSNTSTPLPAPTATVVPPVLLEHFAVLNESGAGGTGVASIGSASVSSATVTALTETTEGLNVQFGLNPSLAREAPYNTSQHVWVIPGSKGICLHDFETGQGSCGPISDAIAGTAQLDVGGGEHGVTGGGTIYGLVPNGNSMVVVHDANGSTEDVPVQHNVYIISRRGAVSVRLVNGAGQAQTITVP